LLYRATEASTDNNALGTPTLAGYPRCKPQSLCHPLGLNQRKKWPAAPTAGQVKEGEKDVAFLVVMPANFVPHFKYSQTHHRKLPKYSQTLPESVVFCPKIEPAPYAWRAISKEGEEDVVVQDKIVARFMPIRLSLPHQRKKFPPEHFQRDFRRHEERFKRFLQSPNGSCARIVPLARNFVSNPAKFSGK